MTYRSTFIKRIQIISLLFLVNVSFAHSQNIGLYEILDEPQQEWASKQVADLQRASIVLNQDLLQNLRSQSIDQFSVMGLNGELYQVQVTRVMEKLDGDWSLLGHIDGDWMNPFTLSISNGEVLSSLSLVSSHHFLEIRYAEEFNEHFLMHIDPHERDELECGVDHNTTLEAPDDGSIHKEQQEGLKSEESAIIDVMVVYTPAAQSWASSNAGGINNVINQAMAIAQNSVDNSQINLQFRLVYRGVVDYIETGNSRTDLENLTNRNIPNVQLLRNQHTADLVVMLTDTKDTGGIAWLNTNPNGSPSFGYSITRVQQAAWSTTMVHEMGHNMGNNHSRNQTIQPAPVRGGVFNYSTGWRWTGTDSLSYASVMAYTQNSTKVHLFSNPDVLHLGTQTGSYNGMYAPADNSRSMREMMHVIESYRTEGSDIFPPSILTSSVTNISSNSAQAGGNITDDGGSTVTSRGVCLSTQQHPDLSNVCELSGTDIGNFNVTFTNLLANTTYYIRAFATNAEYTSYGSQRVFTTISGLPIVTTSTITDVSFKSALGGGVVTNTGSSAITERGICWSIRQNPDLTNNCRSIAPDSGAFALPIDQLIRDTVYFVRAYATNDQGTAYGEERSFITLPVIVDADRSTISVETPKVQANNRNSSTVTVIARDFEGELLQEFDTQLISKQGTLQVSPLTVTTNSDGEAVFEVTNSKVEQVTYGAISGVAELSMVAAVQFIGIDIQLSSLDISSDLVPADGKTVAKITVTAKDEYNIPFSNIKMELIPDGGNSVIEAVQQTTDSNGKAHFNVSNRMVEHIRYKARGLGLTTESFVEVNFVTVPPVTLAPTEVRTREFQANWELVSNSDSYFLDVASDSSFNNILTEYESLNVGMVTSHRVTGLDPGTDYYYRVRSSTDGLVGANSEQIKTTTFPETPIGMQATDANALTFKSNWQVTEGARNYRIDVSADTGFSEILSDYNNRDVGSITSFEIDGLESGSTYYYRVRAEAGVRTSANSNIIAATTLTASPENSIISQQQSRTLANGNQTNEVNVTVKSDGGVHLKGLAVELLQDGTESQIDAVQSVTDAEGTAQFLLSSLKTGKITYEIFVSGIRIGEFMVEFISDEGVLSLGNNYPNPFIESTILPVSIPSVMEVRIQIFDVLGKPVQTLLNGSLEPGYYEVPFEGYDLSAGIYFYRLTAGDEVLTERMVMVK